MRIVRGTHLNRIDLSEERASYLFSVRSIEGRKRLGGRWRRQGLGGRWRRRRKLAGGASHRTLSARQHEPRRGDGMVFARLSAAPPGLALILDRKYRWFAPPANIRCPSGDKSCWLQEDQAASGDILPLRTAEASRNLPVAKASVRVCSPGCRGQAANAHVSSPDAGNVEEISRWRKPPVLRSRPRFQNSS